MSAMRAVRAQSGCHRRTPVQRSVQVNAEAAIRASVAGTSRFPESAFDVVAVLTPPMSVDLLDDLEQSGASYSGA